MSGVTIQIVGPVSGGRSLYDDQYVVQYDAGKAGGQAPLLVTTKDRAKAKVFPDHTAAHACWTMVRGTRPDGKPDRPLTAFTVLIDRIVEEEEVARVSDHSNG